jgi:hypothetical protein
MSSRYEQVLERLDAFLIELDLLVRQAALQSIQLALSGEAAPETTTPLPEVPEPESAATPPKEGKVRPGRKPAASEAPAQPKARGRRSKDVAGRKTVRGGTRRSADRLEPLMERALKYIRRHPGSRMEQIAEGMAVPSKELTLPLRRLKSEGRLKIKGQKRATSYFAK